MPASEVHISFRPSGTLADDELLRRYCEGLFFGSFPLVSGNTSEPSRLTVVFKTDANVELQGFQARLYLRESLLSWNTA